MLQTIYILSQILVYILSQILMWSTAIDNSSFLVHRSQHWEGGLGWPWPTLLGCEDARNGQHQLGVGIGRRGLGSGFGLLA